MLDFSYVCVSFLTSAVLFFIFFSFSYEMPLLIYLLYWIFFSSEYDNIFYHLIQTNLIKVELIRFEFLTKTQTLSHPYSISLSFKMDRFRLYYTPNK